MSSPTSSAGGASHRYYGKYRGTVVSNVDSQQMGRIRVQVSDVLGSANSSWAMPSVPGAGSQAGMFIVPPAGSQVWVEFEQGDPDYPVWTGGFWGAGAETPPQSSSPPPVAGGQNIVIQTTNQSIIVLSDAPPTPTSGGIILQSGGASIIVNQTGIYISNGTATISLIGNTVAINDTALTVVGS